MKSEGRGKKPEQDLRCIPFIAVLTRGEICPMPHAPCQIVPHVTEKGYIFTLSVVVKYTTRRTLLITSGLTKLAHGEGVLAPSPITLTSPGTDNLRVATNDKTQASTKDV